jgi:uncharacterized membrane protein
MPAPQLVPAFALSSFIRRAAQCCRSCINKEQTVATIQQSIEVNVPVHALYEQLSRFEDYPQFLDNVERVQQIDDTRLHWTTKMANRPVEWDATITKQEADRCIAWEDVSGMSSDCRIEVQALSEESSKATITLEAEPGQFPGLVTGERAEEMKQQLGEAMEKLKDFVEGDRSRHQTTIRASAASFSGSPTEVLEDEPNESKAGDNQ